MLIRMASFAIAVIVVTAGISRADITVFAAASLKGGLDEAAEAWSETSGQEVKLSFAGSSALARQIMQGAPADIFIAASVDWMDVVEAEGLIAANSRRNILRNELVLIGPQSTPEITLSAETDMLALLEGGKLAMALVKAVPAGIYGKAALEWFGLWSMTEDSVAQADNVRAALALVAWGEAPLGIVYATDAVAEPKVSVIGKFPSVSHPPIVYPAALIAEADAGASAFLEFLTSDEGASFFLARGFQAP